jgi:IS5 family transposase
MTEGNNPTDRSKLGTKRHILTDKKGIPLSTIITSASIHDIKVVTDVLDNAVVLKRRPSESYFTKKKRKKMYYHLCLDREHI